MNQNIWGPHLWFSLHTISFVYPLKPNKMDKENYKNFFLSLENVIPCAICKKNYKRHLKEHPIDNYLDSRKNLVYWVIDMHNLVNGEIGKKILSYDTVMKKYETVFNKKFILDSENNEDKLDNDEKYVNNSYNKNENIINGVLGLLIILLIISLYFSINKN
jgi:hypothetical protein